MPSPFPGVDPYIEGQVFAEFHDKIIDEIQVALAPLLRPRYVARIEERVYLEHYLEHDPRQIIPDVAITHDRGAAGARGSSTVTLVAPVPIPLPEEVKETFVEVRLRETQELVTVIEVLSPANKRPGSSGREEYLRKRGRILGSSVHLVEIDLLRGGERLPMQRAMPPGDYYVILSRARRRPIADVWAIGLRSPLPPIPVPLAGEDPDVSLDLQAVFATLYDRAGYDYTLDYRRPIEPPLSPEDSDWARSVIMGRGPQ